MTTQESSQLLTNCHRTNDAFGGGGNRGDSHRVALRLLKVKCLADYKWIAACACAACQNDVA
jgi:hypothetical protein